MKRTLSLACSVAAVATLAVLYALAVQAQEPGGPGEVYAQLPTDQAAAERAAAAAEEQARAAADQARAVAEQARAKAEQATGDARRQAEAAVERAENMVRDFEVEIEAQAEAAVEEFEEALDVIVDADPFAAKNLKFRIAGPKFITRRDADPETMQKFELDRKLSGQIGELAAKYKAAEGDDAKRDLATEIAKRVQNQFTVRQALREKELVELEEQIERLRGLHSRREEEKQRIITDRVQQILREVDGLGWGDGGAEWNTGGGEFKFAPGEFGGGAGFGGFGDNLFGAEGPKKVIARTITAGVPGAPDRITLQNGGDVLVAPVQPPVGPVAVVAPLPAGAAPPPVAPGPAAITVPAVAPVEPAPPTEPARN